MRRFGIQPSELSETRISFLFALADDGVATTNVDYETTFRWTWRKKFEHLSPDVRHVAVNAEWQRYLRGEKP